MIVVSLVLYFLSQVNGISSSLKKWIVAALSFSWLGDVLLMFQPKDQVFFLLGLSAFLVAHIFYIIFFHQVRVKEKLHSNGWSLLIVAAYYFILMNLLSPYLGEFKLPVRVYGVAISFMLMLAIHMLFIKNRIAGIMMLGGAILFVVSDSILAINKFYQPFQLAGVLIMFSYGAAQFFIVEGAIRYISLSYKE